MITKHADSHVDHNLTAAQLEFVLSLDAPDNTVTVQTLELPEFCGSAPCALYGPAMGDDPIPESQVSYATRGNRKGMSRMIDAPARRTSRITVITGPHDGNPCVLFTAFAGPAAPRECFESDSAESRDFWATHALATRE